MATVTMTMEEYLQLLNGLNSDAAESMGSMPPATAEQPIKKRKTAYQRRYKAAFKKIAPKYKLKSGKWSKNGFKKAVKMAHKMAKK